ncbi:MAG: hypothetical protein ACFFER_08065 [Candidatus Thorarchaeota archaeon]
MKKDDHKLIFLGGKATKKQYFNAFDRIFHIPLGNDLNVALNPLLEQKWIRAINKVSPDVLHVNDVIVVKFAFRTNYPTVFDDHEYMSHQIPYFAKRKMPRGLASKPLVTLIPRWESKALKRYPTLTVSDMIAQDHRKHSRWVGVTPNVPTFREISGVPRRVTRKGLVYVGTDFKKEGFYSLRDMSGLRDILEFDVITGLSHNQMMNELTKYKIGLTPWKEVPMHYYACPNKTYEYLHAGLQVVTNRLLHRVFSDNPYVHAFRDYNDILEVIEAVPDVDPSKIMDHAREHYIWEKHEHVIKEAYKRAQSSSFIST